jgi:nucleotide-binding universal stress UspA family protein
MSAAVTILVPVDFSSHSGAAAERALQVARLSDARIEFLHALHFPPLPEDYVYTTTIQRDLRRSETLKLTAFAEEFADQGPPTSNRIEEGDPAEVIRCAARSREVGLIVMGSHGRRGIDRVLLGSVAERTLHDVGVPILVVREDQADAAKPIRSILFATDFSEDAKQAERIVARWARLLHSDVEIFHSIREAAVLFAPYAMSGSSADESELHEAAAIRMKSSLDRFKAAGVSARAKIVHGSPPEEISDRAATIGCQVIAMGSRGYTGLQAVRVGSVAQRVLRNAPCNVLIAGSRTSDLTQFDRFTTAQEQSHV